MSVHLTVGPCRWRVRPEYRNPFGGLAARVESVMVGALILLAVVVAVVLGAVTYVDTAAEFAAEDARKTAVTATVAADPVRAPAPGRHFEAPVRWRTDGAWTTAIVRVPRHAVRGTELTVWLDDRGQLVGPPRSSWQAVSVGVGVGVGALVAVSLAMLGLPRWVRRLSTRRGHAGAAINGTAGGGGSIV